MYPGIDLGTSDVKLLLIDERQPVIPTLHEKLEIGRPRTPHRNGATDNLGIAFSAVP